MNIQHTELVNGIRLVHLHRDSQVAYLGVAINAGSRDEKEDEEGIAHLIEHMLFKGTKKRSAWHVINRMEVVGGELNAYTSKEETIIYSTFLKNHYDRALELLSDILFHSSFRENELIKEKEVVLDEINSYLDNPSELIFDDFEALIFPNDPLGRKILGTPESLESITSESLKSFTQRNYLNEEIVVFSFGNIDFKKLTLLVEKYFLHAALHGNTVRTVPAPLINKNESVQKETYQSHVIMGTRAYSLKHPNRLGLHLLNNILGGPAMISRLNLSLRERRGYVYNVESSVNSYTDSGMFSVYFGTENKRVEKSMDLVIKELKLLKNVALTGTQLSAAKHQLLAQMAISSDYAEQLFLSIGKSFLHFNKFDSIEELSIKLDKLNPTMLQEIAHEIFDESNLNVLRYD